MTEPNPVETAPETSPSPADAEPAIRLRVWPALVVIAAYALTAYGFSMLGSTNVESFAERALVPLGAAVLLLLWWLFASRAPWRVKLGGVLMLAAGLGAAVLSQSANGPMLLVYAVPTLTVGPAGLLALTHKLGWPWQWKAGVLFMVCATAMFMAMRVDTIRGDLAPVVSWRWTATELERSSALAAEEAHGTAALPAEAGPGDWPAFRGAARDSVVKGVRLPEGVFSTPPLEVWRRQVGPAWSSFVAVGDYLFTQEQRGSLECVTCYRADTGETVWSNRVEARYEDTMGLGPRATPTFDRGRLYAQGATGALQCLDASNGAVVWKRDISVDTDTKTLTYGFASSPLVLGELVVVFSGGGEGKSVAAYRRDTGEPAWMTGHAGDGYGSPHFFTLGGVPQIVVGSDYGLQSLVPETGAYLWEHPWKNRSYPRCVQPLFGEEGLILLGSTGDNGSRLVRAGNKDGAWTVEKQWTSKDFRPYFNDGVIHKGYCYGFDGNRLVCIDYKTCKPLWQGERFGGQLLFLEDMEALLILSEEGEVVLVKAVPETFEVLGRFQAITGKTWNHPVLAHGRLFVRNADEAACFQLMP